MKIALMQTQQPRRRRGHRVHVRTGPVHFNVYPRYTPGSPAMVDERTARRVAEQEKDAIRDALSGMWGEQQRERAEALGLLGIAEEVHETKRGWDVLDLVRGDTYLRPFPGRMRKLGWLTWLQLDWLNRMLVVDEYPHHAAQAEREVHRWWFRVTRPGKPVIVAGQPLHDWVIEVWELWRDALDVLGK